MTESFYNTSPEDYFRPASVDRHEVSTRAQFVGKTCVPPTMVASEASLQNPDHQAARAERFETVESPYLV